MHILLCYGYEAHTTAVYFERALEQQHTLTYLGPGGDARRGVRPNEDIAALIERGELPRPDLVLFIESPIKFFPRGFERLGCPTAGYLIDVHTTLWIRENYAPFFDFVFVAHKDYVSHFERLGHRNVHWLPVAADPVIHAQRAAERCYEVGFVGNIEQHPERKRLLLALAERYRMNDFRRPYPKEQIAEIYSRSKIVFNCAINKDVTMRVFEALAAGALLVSNPMENGIDELLQAGEHYVEYRGERSLFDQVDYYLRHEPERAQIAEAGRAAVFARHTYRARCAQLVEIVCAAPSARTAQVRDMSPAQLRAAYGRVYSAFRMVDAAFDEFDLAFRDRQGRLAASRQLGSAFLRRLNANLRLTRFLR